MISAQCYLINRAKIKINESAQDEVNFRILFRLFRSKQKRKI